MLSIILLSNNLNLHYYFTCTFIKQGNPISMKFLTRPNNENDILTTIYIII